jgi:hypothetical protein
MHVGLQKVAQRAVHHALPLDPAAAGEGVRDDQKAEMTFSLRSSTRVPGMAGGVVDQLKPLRLQPGQTHSDLGRDPHRRSLAPIAFTIVRNLGRRAAAGAADYRIALKRAIALHTNCVKLIGLAIEVGYNYLPMIGKGRQTHQG